MPRGYRPIVLYVPQEDMALMAAAKRLAAKEGLPLSKMVWKLVNVALNTAASGIPVGDSLGVELGEKTKGRAG